MNTYIKAQILQMEAYTRTFQQACKLAATKDDGIISKDEEKTLKLINKACANFEKELARIAKKDK